MERRNTDRNNITSSTQYSNQSQRNYNYQHYNDNNSSAGKRVISMVPTQLNGQWTPDQNEQSYSFSEGIVLAPNHTYIIQLFNSDATIKYNNSIVMRQVLTNIASTSIIYAASVTDSLVYTTGNSSITAMLTVAAPKDSSMMRIYMYDVTNYTKPPIIDWEGNIIG